MNVLAFTQTKIVLVGPTQRRRLFVVPSHFTTSTSTITPCRASCRRFRTLPTRLVHPPPLVPMSRGSVRLQFRPQHVWRKQTLQVRSLMDAKLRPSHSGMFSASETATTTPPQHGVPPSAFVQKQPLPPPPSTPTTTFDEPNLYGLLFHRAMLALGLVYVVTEYGADITLCEGPSMTPTIHPYGEIVLVDKSAIRRGVHDGCTGEDRERAARQRQQAHHPPDQWHAPVRSVSDLPTHHRPFIVFWREFWQHLRSPIAIGDVVVAYHPSRPGTVCKRVTGLPGDQILLSGGGKIITVPDGHVWLEGDNPGNSSDSRLYGPLPLALLQGRVVARLWPLRGQAWLRRGARPTTLPHPRGSYPANNSNSGSTVLPAGYQGEHIIKHLRDDTEAEANDEAESSGKHSKGVVKRGSSPS